jgi:hypothetical protein
MNRKCFQACIRYFMPFKSRFSFLVDADC